jgi:hypothetical protein
MLTQRLLRSLALSLLIALPGFGCSTMGRAERQPLELDGPVAVRVDTFAGDVQVRAFMGGTGEQAFVQVNREGLHAINRGTDATEAIENITWTTKIDRDDRGPVVVVEVTAHGDEQHAMRGHVLVQVPILDGVTVHTTRGDIAVDEVTGPIELVTTDGSVEVLSDQPVHGPMKILTSEGDVNIRLAPGASGDLDFFAKDGRVGMHVKTGRMQIEPGTSNDMLSGVLNDGTKPFIIRTTHGVIRFTVKHNPKRFGIFHMD